jgi:hypothetical protein
MLKGMARILDVPLLAELLEPGYPLLDVLLALLGGIEDLPATE